MAEVESWLSKELSGIRTGRASLAVLDNVTVEVYGSKQSIKAVASISLEDAKTIRVMPWDKSQLKGIESALSAANLGLSAVPDGEGIRVVFPDLTTERRELLVKMVKEKLEEARVSLRQEREKTWNEIVNLEKAGKLPEDDKFRGKDDLQKIMDDFNSRLESLAAKKEAELMN